MDGDALCELSHEFLCLRSLYGLFCAPVICPPFFLVDPSYGVSAYGLIGKLTAKSGIINRRQTRYRVGFDSTSELPGRIELQ